MTIRVTVPLLLPYVSRVSLAKQVNVPERGAVYGIPSPIRNSSLSFASRDPIRANQLHLGARRAHSNSFSRRLGLRYPAGPQTYSLSFHCPHASSRYIPPATSLIPVLFQSGRESITTCLESSISISHTRWRIRKGSHSISATPGPKEQKQRIGFQMTCPRSRSLDLQ